MQGLVGAFTLLAMEDAPAIRERNGIMTARCDPAPLCAPDRWLDRDGLRTGNRERRPTSM
jgi:hypothetical protein